MIVRIRNVQSIRDVTLEFSGFTVVTGPNNSGKTAALRAIRGLFTNAPAGPLVRHGTAHLTVDITFEDGQTITWEKGWDRPDRKGGKINRYTVNGKPIEAVGRGVPPEVEKFSVREIGAGSEKLWPQIARQFDVLFLVDRPGSIVAEALSDVERVGRLSDALRLAESDRRTTSSELRVRLEDVVSLETRFSAFDGFDQVLTTTESLGEAVSHVEEMRVTLERTEVLCSRHNAARDLVQTFKDFNPSVIPKSEAAERVGSSLKDAIRMRDSLTAVRERAQSFEGFNAGVLPPLPDMNVVQGYTEHARMNDRLKRARAGLFEAPEITVPEVTRINRLSDAIQTMTRFGARLEGDRNTVHECELALERISEKSRINAAELTDLFSQIGSCPTCGALCEHPL